MALRFNPPPGWPPPPEGFAYEPGWQPDPSWPPAPPGWQLWVHDDVPGGPAVPEEGPSGTLTGSDGGAQPVPAEAGSWLPPGPVTTAANQPPGPGWVAPAPQPSRTSGLAVAAFVLGLLGFLVITAILGIVLGAVALAGLRRSLERGRVLAILGIGFGAGWIVLLAVLIAVGAITGSFSAGTSPQAGSNVPGSQEIPVGSLVTGDCFDFPTSTSASQLSFVEQTPCNQPHNSQVVVTFPVSGSSVSYPGVPKLSDLALKNCDAMMKGRLNSAKVTNSMTGRFLYPLADSWRAGQRTISCIIYSPTSVTSSLLTG